MVGNVGCRREVKLMTKVEHDTSGDLWINEELYVRTHIRHKNVRFLLKWASNKGIKKPIIELVNEAIQAKVNKILAGLPYEKGIEMTNYYNE